MGEHSSSVTDNETDGAAQIGDEVDLSEIWRALLRGKWIIFVFTALFSICFVLYALSIPNTYTSIAILAPSDSADKGGLASLAGNLGGLASLAGVNIDGGSNKTAEALQILQSWAFIEEFIEEQNIAPQVFAAEEWDKESNELIYNENVYDAASGVWTRQPPKGKEPKPSSWELYKAFVKFVTISEDKSSGFTSVELEYLSPELAKDWVDALIDKINLKIQTRDSAEAERNIEFLKQQVQLTSINAMHAVFYQLIEEQTKTLMLASGSSEYVFRTINEARVAEEKSNPKRALICIFGAVLGCVMGSVVAVSRVLRR